MPDKVESIWDIERQLKDGQQLLALLAEVKAQILATPKIMLDYKGANGIAEAKAATESLVVANNNLNIAQKSLISVQQQVTQSTIDLINQRGRLQNTLNSYNATQKEDLALLKSRVITEAEYRQRVVENTLKIEQYKVKVEDLNKEIKSSIGTKSQLIAREKEEAKIAAELSSDYKQLSLAYEAAAKRAKDYSASLGIAHPISVQAQKDANALGSQLKAIDSTVGQSQRNVGNYSSALSKAWSGLKTIANILPGVGIATLLGFAIEPITKWIGSLFKASDATSFLAEKTKLLNDVMADANKNAGKELADLEIVYKATQDLTLSQNERIKSAKFLQATYPETFANFSTEEIMLGKATSGYNDLTAAILRNALAAAARAQLEQLSAQKLAAEFQKQKIKNATDNESAAARERNLGNGGGGGSSMTGGGIVSNTPNTIITVAQQRAVIEERRNKALAEQDKLLKSITNQEKFLIDFAGAGNLVDTVIGKPKPSKSSTNTTGSAKESTKASLDSDFELYKISQLRKIKLLQEGVDDERKTYDERIALLQDFSTESITLAKAQGKEDVRVLNEKLEAQQSNLKKAKGTERNNLLIEIANTQTAIAIVNKKENDNELNIRDAHNKKFLDLEKQHNDLLKKAKEQLYKDMQDYAKQYGTDVQLKLEAEQFEKIKQLDIDFAAGRIETIKEYREKKAEIENQYNKKEINTDIVVQNLLLELAETNGKSEVEIQTKILELKKRLYELDTKNLLNEAEKKDAIRREEYDAAMKLGEQVEETAKSFFEGKFDREKNEIEESKRLIDEQTESKINNVNKELITEQEKANKITAIQALAAAKKQNLDNKQKEIDYKKAVFEKGVAIFDVIKNTAIAISKDLIDKKYLIPFDIAIGAAQVAAILARPIPKYKDGTESSKKGWALTDEAGPELYIKPDGSMEVGNDRPTLRYLEQGTKIIPHDEVNQYIMNRMMQSTAKALTVEDKKTDEIKEAILWGTKETVKALKKSKRTSVNIHLDSNFGPYIKKQVFE
jgi:hypothetical protein